MIGTSPVGNLLAKVGAARVSQIKSIASRHSVEDWTSVYNLVADLPSAQISDARSTHRTTFKKDYLQNPQYTSCLASADRLFALGSEGTAVTGAGDHKQFASALRAQAGSTVAIHAAITGGQHGFVIVIQGDRAEILQSFAGASGARLISSFGGGKEQRTFSLDALVDLINRMDEAGAQQQLFGGGVDASKTMQWSVAKLRSTEDIDQRFGAQLDLGIKALK